MSIYVGMDIGGTKCAVSLGTQTADGFRITAREEIQTPAQQQTAMDWFCQTAETLCRGQHIAGVGISAGGPLDSESGELQNPPNLPGWKGVSLTRLVQQRLHAPCVLENDANACALAEWRWGAGQGARSMAFFTFGTGFGAGLILNNQLYRGATGDAGEAGHWRLTDYGPAGYGKLGSFEGYCSGGGIRRLAIAVGEAYYQRGETPAYWPDDPISAKSVALAARAGDPAALEVYEHAGTALGRGLALVIDLLNPERIVLGSIYARSGDLLEPSMRKALAADAIPRALAAVQILPAKLGDQIGDYAALALAKQAQEQA